MSTLSEPNIAAEVIYFNRKASVSKAFGYKGNLHNERILEDKTNIYIYMYVFNALYIHS